jgi:hypothetical protein
MDQDWNSDNGDNTGWTPASISSECDTGVAGVAGVRRRHRRHQRCTSCAARAVVTDKHFRLADDRY